LRANRDDNGTTPGAAAANRLCATHHGSAEERQAGIQDLNNNGVQDLGEPDRGLDYSRIRHGDQGVIQSTL
jgi:hypothetical protein